MPSGIHSLIPLMGKGDLLILLPGQPVRSGFARQRATFLHPPHTFTFHCRAIQQIMYFSRSRSIKRCLFLLLAMAFAGAVQLEPGDLRRCFERYDGYKLLGDARPYHSEWRHQNEELCLEFCVKSASRCASIVYDKAHHICHYFGTKDLHAVGRQRKFVWLRVADAGGGACMESMRAQLLLNDQDSSGASTNVQNSTTTITTSHPESAVDDIYNNNNTSTTTVENLVASTIDDAVARKSVLEQLESELLAASSSSSSAEMEDGAWPAIVGEAPAPKKPSGPDPEIRRAPRIDDRRREQLGRMGEATGGEQRGAALSRNADAPNLGDQQNPVMAQTENRDNEEEDEQGGNVCEPDSQRIWLAVENARIMTPTHRQLQKGASTPRECVRVCANITLGSTSPCNAFSFSERDKRCTLTHSDEQFPMRGTLEPVPQGDFSQRAFRQFCYPVSLSPFEQCSEFLAFTDYRLETDAREVFDGLPAAAEGLSACIELCVLSSEFRCMSASFDAIRGVCRLFSEHSLSQPDAFREHTEQSQLYFENGCAESAGEISEEISQRSSVQRMDTKLMRRKL